MRQIETNNALGKPRAIAIFDKHCPDGGDLLIKLNHRHVIGEVFGSDREADDAAAGERLNEFMHRLLEPLTNAWHEPCLAAGIAKRAALRHRCHIDYTAQ